jgi:hypothetical protein
MKHIFLMVSVFFALPLSSFASEHTPASPQDFEITRSNPRMPMMSSGYTVTYTGPNKYDSLWCGAERRSITLTTVSTPTKSYFEVKNEQRHRVVCYSKANFEDHTPKNKVFEFDIPQGG